MTGQPSVGFDALFLEQPMTGAGQYALNLWRQLRDCQEVVSPHLLMPADAPDVARAAAGNSAVTTAAQPRATLRGRGRKVWWEQVGLVSATRRSGVDLVHIPYFSAPLRQSTPHVVTVHDVIPLVLPEYAGSRRMRMYLRVVSRAARKASLVLTDSEHSRRDITRCLGIAGDRIRVTPLAAGSEFSPAQSESECASVERVKQRFGLRAPFVLNVGGFDLRKRLPHLLRGFAAALPMLPEPYDLVIAGNPHTANASLNPPLEPIIGELGISDRVRLVGFVSHEDKRDLYRAATLFAFVSEYEGFGLNPLEAMACGAPVICSNRSSLPEVVGDAGLSIDPEPDDIARAIVCAATDPALRADLARRSLRRASSFSWEQTAALTLDAYQYVLDRSQ
ncbi:MAG TPA: glycosyltransferase family 1 protein [Thermomicrobiales bacterium]|nr:glycosyltransferase family 1 protein [Thermomicrobiales bacterium]